MGKAGQRGDKLLYGGHLGFFEEHRSGYSPWQLDRLAVGFLFSSFQSVVSVLSLIYPAGLGFLYLYALFG